MTVRVIVPPEPFLLPTDIDAAADPNDAGFKLMIAAVTEELDGYTGSLGRCLAPQLIEWSLDRWPSPGYCLPIGPELEIDSVTYVDPAGASHAWAFPTPLYFENLPSVRGRMGDVRIRYWAGYGARNVADPTKWVEAVPARVKQAVTLSVQHMRSLGSENLFLRSEDVEGVGVTTYTVSEQAGAVIRDATRYLLSGLKVHRI